MADRFRDADPTNDLVDLGQAGGAAPTSPGGTFSIGSNAPAKFFNSNLGGQQGSWITNYKNPGGPITTNMAGSANIPGPADFSSYAKVTPGGIPGLTKGQMYFPYGHSTATNMDMFGNPVTINRMPGWAGLAASMLGAGALGSLLRRDTSSVNGDMGNMQNAGPQPFTGAQQGPLVTTAGVVPYSGGPLPLGNPMGSLSNEAGMPGQPQLGNTFTNTNAQMGANLYNMANTALQNYLVGGVQGLGRGLQNTGNFLQSSGVANFVANPITSTGNRLAGFGQQAINAGSPLQFRGPNSGVSATQMAGYSPVDPRQNTGSQTPTESQQAFINMQRNQNR